MGGKVSVVVSRNRHENEGILTLKEVSQSENMFSARIEKGPVTPRIVKGWIENLERKDLVCSYINSIIRQNLWHNTNDVQIFENGRK